MATKTKSKSDIGRSSKRKGKIGELEVVNLLKAPQYCTLRWALLWRYRRCQ